MKNLIRLLSIILPAFTFYACNNATHNFVGKWKYCNNPADKVWCTIAKQDNDFVINGTTKNLVMKEKSDELLAADSSKIFVRFERSTSHIFISRGTAETLELCRIN